MSQTEIVVGKIGLALSLTYHSIEDLILSTDFMLEMKKTSIERGKIQKKVGNNFTKATITATNMT